MILTNIARHEKQRFESLHNTDKEFCVIVVPCSISVRPLLEISKLSFEIIFKCEFPRTRREKLSYYPFFFLAVVLSPKQFFLESISCSNGIKPIHAIQSHRQL